MIAGTAVKKSTPLYGQPSWWGENDADEHNKQLLKDIQSQREQEKQQKSANAAEVTKAAAAVSSSRSSPPNPPKNMSAVLSKSRLSLHVCLYVCLYVVVYHIL